MGNLLIKRGASVIISNAGNPILNGIYFVQDSLINNRKWYKKGNIAISWSADVSLWALYFIGTPLVLDYSTFSTENPWDSLWEDGQMIVKSISLTEKTASIRKQNLGGGKAIIKQHNNLFTCPFNMDTLECPSSGLNGPGWLLGSQAIRFGKTIAPDGTNTAVEYQSNLINSCYVSQGYLSYWRPNTKYIISVWAKLTSGNFINGTIINATRNNFNDRIFLNAVGNLTSEWNRFTIDFTTGPENFGGYTTVFFFEGFSSGARVALWGAKMYIEGD